MLDTHLSRSANTMEKNSTANTPLPSESTITVTAITLPATDQILEKLPPLPDDEGLLVSFNEPTDAQNPRDWSMSRKWLVTSVLSLSGFNRIMVSSIMAPALTTIATELRMDSVEAVMSMTVYLLASAFGPLAIGPLSEVYGRAPLLHITNVWFLIWNMICGFAHSKGLLLTARLFAGLGASAIYALGGGVLGDVWRPEQRGRSLGLYWVVPLLGAAVGPILGGYITELTNWRWIFWSTSCAQAVVIVFSILFFRETYAPVILQKRARHLRQSTGNVQYQTAVEKLDADRSVIQILSNSLSRPFRLLLFHPIIQISALFSGFRYGVLYLVITSFSELYTTQYHESVSTSGLHYIALCIGEIAGVEIVGPLMDLVFRKLKTRANGSSIPEFHIPIVIPGGLLTPIGLILYGWAAEKHAFWFVVDLGAAIFTFGIQTGLGLQAYVIDSYPLHTSSALAASQFLRSMFAFGLPLLAPRMYKALGYGWGNTLLGFLTLIIGTSVPVFIWSHGAKLRVKAQSSH